MLNWFMSGILGIDMKTFGIQIHFCRNHCDCYRYFLNLRFISEVTSADSFKRAYDSFVGIVGNRLQNFQLHLYCNVSKNNDCSCWSICQEKSFEFIDNPFVSFYLFLMNSESETSFIKVYFRLSCALKFFTWLENSVSHVAYTYSMWKSIILFNSMDYHEALINVWKTSNFSLRILGHPLSLVLWCSKKCKY